MGSESRVYGPQYSRALQNICGVVNDVNRVVILEFLERECTKRGLTERRKQKYIAILYKVLKLSPNLRDLSQTDAESFFIWLRQASQYADDTKQDYWNMYRKLAEFINPDIKVKDFKLHIKRKRKLPEEILSEEEILSLKKEAKSIRDRAMISILAEAGMRVGELINLRIKDVNFDQYGAVLMVSSICKTGARRIRIVNSAQILSLYLQEHRYVKDPEAPLFYRYDKHYKQLLSSTGINSLLKATAKRAGITKRVYPHLLRHSRATHLANKLTEQQLKAYLGWVGDSRMAAVYVHLSGKDIDNAILQVNGIKSREEDQKSPLQTRPCLKCKELNDASLKYCGRCGSPLSEKEALSAEAAMKDNDFQSFLMELYSKWKERK